MGGWEVTVGTVLFSTLMNQPHCSWSLARSDLAILMWIVCDEHSPLGQRQSKWARITLGKKRLPSFHSGAAWDGSLTGCWLKFFRWPNELRQVANAHTDLVKLNHHQHATVTTIYFRTQLVVVWEAESFLFLFLDGFYLRNYNTVFLSTWLYYCYDPPSFFCSCFPSLSWSQRYIFRISPLLWYQIVDETLVLIH